MAVPVTSTIEDEPEELDPELAAALQSHLPGEWSEDEYLILIEQWNAPLEYSAGCIEVLTMPTDRHHAILSALFLVFNAIAQQIGGKVYFMGIRIRLWSGKFREPDIVFLRSIHDPRRSNRYWDGADLVLEVVSDSPTDRRRDLVTKRRDYARAGILEYWIVDPQDEIVTVLQLKDSQYVEHGVFARGDVATSALLSDLRVDVSATFDA